MMKPALLILIAATPTQTERRINATGPLSQLRRISRSLDTGELTAKLWSQLGDATCRFYGRNSPLYRGDRTFHSVEKVDVVHEFDYDEWLESQDRDFRANFQTAMTGTQRKSAVERAVKTWKTSTEFPWYTIRLEGQADWLDDAIEGRPYEFQAALKDVEVIREIIGKYQNPFDRDGAPEKPQDQPRLILTMQLVPEHQAETDPAPESAQPPRKIAGDSTTIPTSQVTINRKNQRSAPTPAPTRTPQPQPDRTLAQSIEDWLYSYDKVDWILGFVAVIAVFTAIKVVRSQTGN